MSREFLDGILYGVFITIALEAAAMEVQAAIRRRQERREQRWRNRRVLRPLQEDKGLPPVQRLRSMPIVKQPKTWRTHGTA
jgi:hypothetical protein